MYLFHRSVRLGPGNLRHQLSWALAMTEKVNQISESTFRLWTPAFSPGIGTLVWGTIVDELSELEATEDKLMVDDGYHMLVEEGAKFSSGDAINDGLSQYLYADIDRTAEPPAYLSVVTASLNPGQMVHGVEVGIEIAQRATQSLGVPVSFLKTTTGDYEGVEWIAGYASVEQLQKGGESLGADVTFAQYIDTHAAQVFRPQTRQTVLRRLA